MPITYARRKWWYGRWYNCCLRARRRILLLTSYDWRLFGENISKNG
jgi:hypothetical protein